MNKLGIDIKADNVFLYSHEAARRGCNKYFSSMPDTEYSDASGTSKTAGSIFKLTLFDSL